MRSYFVLIFLMMTFNCVSAQNSSDFQKDSLELDELINQIKNQSVKDSVQIFKYRKQAEEKLAKHYYRFSKGNFILSKSAFYFGKNDLVNAGKYVNEAYEFFSEIKTKKDREWGMAKASMLKAVLVGLEGNKTRAQEIYLEVIPVFEKNQDLISLNTAYGNLGLIFYDAGQYEKAQEYFLKSLNTQVDSQKNSRSLGNSELNMAMVSNQLNDLEQMNQYLEKAKSVLSQRKDTLPQWALYYNLQADYNLAKGKFDVAIFNNQKALKVAKKYEDYTYKMNAVSGIAHAFYLKGDYRNSLFYLKQYYEDTKRYKFPQSTISSLENLADLSDKIGDSKQAYLYMLERSELKDSLDQKTIVERLHSLEAEFQSAQKEKEIAQLQYE